jgi:hypothetical protein
MGREPAALFLASAAVLWNDALYRPGSRTWARTTRNPRLSLKFAGSFLFR